MTSQPCPSSQGSLDNGGHPGPQGALRSSQAVLDRRTRHELVQSFAETTSPAAGGYRSAYKAASSTVIRQAIESCRAAKNVLPKTRVSYFILNDGTPLAYKKFSPSTPPRSVAIFLAFNSVVPDFAAFQLSQRQSTLSYVVDLRGHGRSGGPRGSVPFKDTVFNDLRLLVRSIRLSLPAPLPLFLSTALSIYFSLVGHYRICGLLLNYDVWRLKEPVDGYVFVTPLLELAPAQSSAAPQPSSLFAKKFSSNIIISRLTFGICRGTKPALQYSFPEEFYSLNPLMVDTVCTNLFLASSPNCPERLIESMQSPLLIILGDQDPKLLRTSFSSLEGLSRHPLSKYMEVSACNSVSLLTDKIHLISAWVERTASAIAHSVALSKSLVPAASPSSHSSFPSDLLSVAVSGDPCPSPRRPLLYLEAFDGSLLSYDLVEPSEPPKAVLVLWQGSWTLSFLESLSRSSQLTIYRFDIRDAEGLSSHKDLLRDVRLSVVFCKTNHPQLAVFLGGYSLGASLVLNYSSWRRCISPHAYLFVAPIPDSTLSNNRQFCTPLLASKTRSFSDSVPKRGCCRTSYSPFLHGVLSRRMKDQLKDMKQPFGLWLADQDEFVRGADLIRSVNVHFSGLFYNSASLLHGLNHSSILQSYPTLVSDWIVAVASSLNPSFSRTGRDSKGALGSFKYSDFELVELIGKGSFGIVYLVHHKKTKRYMAMKVLQKRDLVQNHLVKQVLREKDILQTCGGGAFIVPFIGSFKDSSYLYFVMEFLVGGELFTLMEMSGTLPLHWVRFYAAEVLVALGYLHSHGIIYRDLKPENLLLDALGHIRLIDFGLSRKLSAADARCTTFCGSPFYMAPEMIHSRSYSMAADLWAFGVLLYEMAFSRLPFFGRTPKQIYSKILLGKVDWPSESLGSSSQGSHSRSLLSSSLTAYGSVASSTSASDYYIVPSIGDAKDLISRLFVLDPKDRLGCAPAPPSSLWPYSSIPSSFAPIMEHPFFRGIDWDALSNRMVVPPFQPLFRSPSDTNNFVNPMMATLQNEEVPSPHRAFAMMMNRDDDRKRGLPLFGRQSTFNNLFKDF